MFDRPLKLKNSSQVHKASYDPRAQRLTLQLNGGTFAYHDVPAEIADGLQKADSHGDYFHEHIRSKPGEPKKFEYTRVN
jgi:hypothetical protein